jgi:hypothetical protein
LNYRTDECKVVGNRWDCWPVSAKDAATSVAVPTDRDLEVYRITTEHFRHVLSALWAHSSYFAIFQGALFSVFVAAIGPHSTTDVPGLVSRRTEALFIAFAGLLFAVFWAAVSHQRLKALNLWRENLMHMDGAVDRHGVYLRVEPQSSEHWWSAPSSITAQLPWPICAAWIVMILWLFLFM